MIGVKGLISAGVVAVLIVMALIAVRQVLVRDVIRTAVESRLSAILGRQVTIGRLDFTLFPRLSVTGRDVRFGGAGAVTPALGIGSVRLVPRANVASRRSSRSGSRRTSGARNTPDPVSAERAPPVRTSTEVAQRGVTAVESGDKLPELR